MVCFFFNDTATTEIYTLSLHDALPIWSDVDPAARCSGTASAQPSAGLSRSLPVARLAKSRLEDRDRKSTRLNSSHANISYAVFCLKKKKLQCRRTPHTRDEIHIFLLAQ